MTLDRIVQRIFIQKYPLKQLNPTPFLVVLHLLSQIAV